MSDMMQNLKSMFEHNNQIPENMKEMLGSIINSNSQSKDTSSNADLSTASAPQTNASNSNFDFSKIDMNTLLKMQQIMQVMNSEQSNPRSNLLRSLKPYLRPSRQQQVDQYIQLLNMEGVFKMMNQPPPSKTK